MPWGIRSVANGHAHQAKVWFKEQTDDMVRHTPGRGSSVSHDVFDSDRSPEVAVDRHTGPGVIVLSASMRVLHMNRQAVELAKHMTLSSGLLPTVVTELCAEIMKDLQVRIEQQNWEQFEVTRVAGNPSWPVLLRGFGLPEQTGGIQRSRMVVTLTKVDSGDRVTEGHSMSGGHSTSTASP